MIVYNASGCIHIDYMLGDLYGQQSYVPRHTIHGYVAIQFLTCYYVVINLRHVRLLMSGKIIALSH